MPAEDAKKSEEKKSELPFVYTVDIANLPDTPGKPHGAIAIQITYSTSAEKFERKQWERAVFAMERPTAIDFANAMLSKTGHAAAAPDRPKKPEPASEKKPAAKPAKKAPAKKK